MLRMLGITTPEHQENEPAISSTPDKQVLDVANDGATAAIGAAKMASQRAAMSADRAPGGPEAYNNEELVVDVAVAIPRPAPRVIDNREELNAKEARVHSLEEKLVQERDYREGLGAQLAETRDHLGRAGDTLTYTESRLTSTFQHLSEQQHDAEYRLRIEAELFAMRNQIKESLMQIALKEKELLAASQLVDEVEHERTRRAALESNLPMTQQQLQQIAQELASRDEALQHVVYERSAISDQLSAANNEVSQIEATLQEQRRAVQDLQNQVTTREAELERSLLQLQHNAADQERMQKLLEAADLEIKRLDEALLQRQQQVQAIRSKAGKLEQAYVGTTAMVQEAVLAEHIRMEENVVYLLNKQITTQQLQLDDLHLLVQSEEQPVSELESLLRSACRDMGRATSLAQEHKSSLTTQIQQLEINKSKLVTIQQTQVTSSHVLHGSTHDAIYNGGAQDAAYLIKETPEIGMEQDVMVLEAVPSNIEL